jgi:hypothetical protein
MRSNNGILFGLFRFDKQRLEHGGAVGLRDNGLLEAALARRSTSLPIHRNPIPTFLLLPLPMPSASREITRSPMATSEPRWFSPKPSCF